MYAIVTAGGIPQPEESLYTYSKGNSKALIDLAGKPMVQWVLDALNEARQVEEIILIGLTSKSGLVSAKPIHYLSNQGKMLANIVAGVNKAVELNNKTEYVLVVSSDIPSVRGDMVDWLIDTCMETKDDLYYGVCPSDVMEARFPESKRTYTVLKDMKLCGADMNITHVRMATEHLDVWEALISRRKNPVAQASVMGWGTLFLLLTRQATLEDFVSRVSERVGIKGRAIVWDRAEPAMDVDKPHQLEMLRAELEKRVAKEISAEKRAAKKAATDSTLVEKTMTKTPAKTSKKPSKAVAKSKPKAASSAKKKPAKPAPKKPATRKKAK